MMFCFATHLSSPAYEVFFSQHIRYPLLMMFKFVLQNICHPLLMMFYFAKHPSSPDYDVFFLQHIRHPLILIFCFTKHPSSPAYDILFRNTYVTLGYVQNIMLYLNSMPGQISSKYKLPLKRYGQETDSCYACLEDMTLGQVHGQQLCETSKSNMSIISLAKTRIMVVCAV